MSRHWHRGRASRTGRARPRGRSWGIRRLPQISTGPVMLHVHAPMGGVDMVRAPAGDHAGAELLACGASRGDPRSRSAGGRAAPCSRPRAWSRARRRNSRLDGTGIGGASGPEGSPGRPTSTRRSVPMRPLRTSSQARWNCGQGWASAAASRSARCGPIAFDRVRHPAPLGDGERGGLLQIDVLARAHGIDGEPGVLVIGRGDQHRVDVLRSASSAR